MRMGAATQPEPHSLPPPQPQSSSIRQSTRQASAIAGAKIAQNIVDSEDHAHATQANTGSKKRSTNGHGQEGATNTPPPASSADAAVRDEVPLLQHGQHGFVCVHDGSCVRGEWHESCRTCACLGICKWYTRMSSVHGCLLGSSVA